VSSKGQITLPKEIRDRHHLTAGATVRILDSEGGVFVRAGRKTLRGLARGRLHVEEAEREIRPLRDERIPLPRR
jgi:AbrB family looped-hinge helix DNA binding protein